MIGWLSLRASDNERDVFGRSVADDLYVEAMLKIIPVKIAIRWNPYFGETLTSRERTKSNISHRFGNP